MKIHTHIMYRSILVLPAMAISALLGPAIAHSQTSSACDFLLPGIGAGGTVSEINIAQCTNDPCSILIPQTDAQGNVTFTQPAGCLDPNNICDLLIPQTSADGSVSLVAPQGCGRLDPCSTVIPFVGSSGDVRHLRPAGCELAPASPTSGGGGTGGSGTNNRPSGGGGRRGPPPPNWRLLSNRNATQVQEVVAPRTRRAVRRAAPVQAIPAHSAAGLPPTGPVASTIALTLFASASASLAQLRYKRRK